MTPSRIFMSRRIAAAALALLSITAAGIGRPAAADTLVLVQGYLGSAHSFRASGVAGALVGRGWQDAGHLVVGPDGRFHAAPATSPTPAARRFYTIELPTEAPIALQARILGDGLASLAARHGTEPLDVVGHSAGGIVARFAAVTDRRFTLRTLLTIASPHLGTEAAEVGSFIGNSPLAWITPFFGAGTINRSQALYQDLWRERPGTALGWLNRQPHPRLRYVSVIRSADPRLPHAGDDVVAGWSQDMNGVPALRGSSEIVVTPGGHGLQPEDGPLIADLLAPVRTAARAEPMR